ncbi:4-hydroxy-tetrahydrodipicolinate reductase [Scatolibacter rhodanostii]|uniref:4-hydroxy-tetrahydrodipicolinate reductase n=1 Tax=Scatolibacter rhodanostii TaxID=2014781 RepID=UPI000C087450|nr:4-hydroxy-tetrahydrodipicolinate reductase [Scatolibacter rhodanostii]
MINIILYGCGGKMGRTIQALVNERQDCQIVAGVDVNVCENTDFPVYHEIASIAESADAIIDFSHPSSLPFILDYCKTRNIAAVLCTTGYSDEQVAEIQKAAATLPLFYSRNMSLGINLLIELAKKAELILGDDFDVEIIEKHHNQKIDAPSGTALMIADAINDTRNNEMKYTYDRHSRRMKRDKSEIGLHAIRGGTIVGEHEVIFAGRHETLSLSHSAQSKELFASGAVNAAIFMNHKPAGLYDMSDLV